MAGRVVAADTPKRLRRPLALDPVAFADAVRDLSGREVGCLLRLACAAWETGFLPTRPCELGAILNIEPEAAVEVTRRLAPHLAPGSYLAVLRAAHVRKAGRRSAAGSRGAAARWGVRDVA